MLSTLGKHDGLYWVAAEGDAEAPLAPLVAQARDEGYPVDSAPGRPRQPYQGYYFRILAAQGARYAERRTRFLSGSRMINGFALVAWPATYGTSGIMTFIVNQDESSISGSRPPHGDGCLNDDPVRPRSELGQGRCRQLSESTPTVPPVSHLLRPPE